MCQIMLTRVPTALTGKRKKIPTFKGIKSDSYHIQKFKMDQKSKYKHNYKTHKKHSGKLHDTGYGNGILNIILKAQTIKRQSHLIKI